MAVISLLLISLLIFINPTSSSCAHRRINPPSIKDQLSSSDMIHQACKATRYQHLCESSLKRYPKGYAMQIIQSAVSVSAKNLNDAQSMAQSILDASSKAHRLKHFAAAMDCLKYLDFSANRLNATAEALSRGKIKDGRSIISGALAFQYDCGSALKHVNDRKMINETVSFVKTLISYTSNALSMMMAYDVHGDNMASWSPPETERDGFWDWERESRGSGSQGPQLGVPAGLKADVTVCKKKGKCNFQSVQEAVSSGPPVDVGQQFVVRVKAGVYHEKTWIGLKNVVLLGEGMGKTVITGNLSVGQSDYALYETATVGVAADKFMARDLTIQNTAGPDGHEAVAFRSDSDYSVLENCEILGNQVTLYAHSGRQFYKSCRIQGNVDFIFGNAASIFENCTILVRPRQLKSEKGENNVVTAHGRFDPAQTTGFVFRRCVVNGTEEYMKLYYSNPKVHNNYLGRPWKEFSRTVFIDCKLGALIRPEGWMPFDGNFGLKTLYYGEFGNKGKGSNLTGRVPWSSRIPAERLDVYSIKSFLQGDKWNFTFC